jgi:molybdopterin-guanine dinucleotide biosynthesis protein A
VGWTHKPANAEIERSRAHHHFKGGRIDEMRHKVCGVLLAGGQSQRMGGGDKCLRQLGGKTILDHVIARAKPQVNCLVLNANGDPARFAGFGLPSVGDSVHGFAGPLAGVLAGMEWAAKHASVCDLVATFATDAPFLPLDLVARLEDGMIADGADISRAASGGRAHPVFALWPVSLREELREAMLADEVRKVDVFTDRFKLTTVDWPAEPVDPFFNTNRPEDLAEAETLLAEHAAG